MSRVLSWSQFMQLVVMYIVAASLHETLAATESGEEQQDDPHTQTQQPRQEHKHDQSYTN